MGWGTLYYDHNSGYLWADSCRFQYYIILRIFWLIIYGNSGVLKLGMETVYSVRFGSVKRLKRFQFGSAEPTQSDSAWTDLNRLESTWVDLNRLEPTRTDSNRLEPTFSRLESTWVDFTWTDLIKPFLSCEPSRTEWACAQAVFFEADPSLHKCRSEWHIGTPSSGK